MIREFHGGSGAAWVPMGSALSKILQGIKNEGVAAGDESLQKLVAGVHGVSEEYASSVRRALIEYNLQRTRKEVEVGNENKKLSSALEVEKEKSLVVKAEKEKALKANRQLIAVVVNARMPGSMRPLLRLLRRAH
jgi:hypothetical protein